MIAPSVGGLGGGLVHEGADAGDGFGAGGGVGCSGFGLGGRRGAGVCAAAVGGAIHGGVLCEW